MAIWPTAVATDADLYVAVNSLQTTLATALGTGDVSVVLASATGFPVAGAVTIGNEVIFYTNISGATLTGCTRGADGTTAATHSVGVPVGATIVAIHHNCLKDEVKAIEGYLNTRFGLGGTAFTNARALQSNASTGIVEVSSVTATELGYLSGVTSAIQTQFGLKAALASPTFTGTVVAPTVDVTTINHTGGTAIKGSNSNNSAAAGDRGEVVNSSVADSSAVSSTGTNQYFDITSVSLTAGSWLIFARYGFTANGATVTDTRYGVSSTSGNSSTGLVFGDNVFSANVNPSASADSAEAFGGYIVRLTGTTTHYLKARMTFTVATAKAYGTITAIRFM